MSRSAIAVWVGACTFATTALGQSLNIRFGSAASTPSAGYAAAGLAGVWNTFQFTTEYSVQPLVSLQGTPVTAQYYQAGSSSILAYDNPLTTGDDGKLMDNMFLSTNSPTDGCFWVQGLMLGQYEVTMYAMTPNNSTLMSRTRVDNGSPGPTMVGGTWPGHHQQGITYARFTVTTNDGTVAFHDGLAGANIQSGINGVQLRFLGTCPVPTISSQPASVVMCLGGTVTFHVAGSGNGTALGYRWQIETQPPGTNVWSDLADGTIPGQPAQATNSGTDTLTVTSQANIGTVRFRCRVMNACGSTNSDPATLSAYFGGSGDGNASGAADGEDVQGFVTILMQGGTRGATYCAYDMNHDNIVSIADLPGFVTQLLSH